MLVDRWWSGLCCSTSESLYGEEVVIVSSPQPSKPSDLPLYSTLFPLFISLFLSPHLLFPSYALNLSDIPWQALNRLIGSSCCGRQCFDHLVPAKTLHLSISLISHKQWKKFLSLVSCWRKLGLLVFLLSDKVFPEKCKILQNEWLQKWS